MKPEKFEEKAANDNLSELEEVLASLGRAVEKKERERKRDPQNWSVDELQSEVTRLNELIAMEDPTGNDVSDFEELRNSYQEILSKKLH